jgi:hypothetical protein
LGISTLGGSAYLTGETESSDFSVTSGSYQGGTKDAFIIRLDSTGSMNYGTFLGGTGEERGNAIQVDSDGWWVVVGDTNSSDFPVTTNSYDPDFNGESDGYVVRYDLSAPDPITYGTYLGGSGIDNVSSVALDAEGYATLTDSTTSTDFPTTTGAYQTNYQLGSADAYVAKLDIRPRPTLTIEKSTNGVDADIPPGPTLLVGQVVTWTYTVTNTGNVSLGSISVTDDVIGVVSCPKTKLNPDEAMSCEATGTAQEGLYSNLGTVNAEYLALMIPVSDSDASHYTGVFLDRIYLPVMIR